MHPTPARRAITLIELLIVVAIIAILAAIAVPNFLEAQTRSKIARAGADMRTISVGIEAYVVDWNNEPRVYSPGINPAPNFSSWWGFTSIQLTTPVAYLSSWPRMAFWDDTTRTFWMSAPNDGSRYESNQAYTVIRDTGTARWPVGSNSTLPSAPAAVVRSPIPGDWYDQVMKSGYVVYTAGADKADGTVWGSPMIYDASNGTISWGDVYRFGNGSPDDNDRTN